MRTRILDQPIDIISMEEASYIAEKALISSRQIKIVTLNPEMVINASNDFEFQATINNANLIVPDGTGIIWALKLLNPGLFKNAKRIPGIELCEKMLITANELSKKVAVFGGTNNILGKLSSAFKNKYPNINLVKTVDGYQGKEKDFEIANIIASCNPDLVLIALGSPRQEIWINTYADLFPQSIMIGVGGSLDVWSGKCKRAPQWIRDISLEWLFRALSQPQRTSRILKTLPRFIYMVLREKIKQSKS